MTGCFHRQMEYYSVRNNGPSHCVWFSSACNCSSKPCSIPISHVVKVNPHNTKSVCSKLQQHLILLAAVCLCLYRRHTTLTTTHDYSGSSLPSPAVPPLNTQRTHTCTPPLSTATPQSASNLCSPCGCDLHLQEMSEKKRIKTNLRFPLQLITVETTYSCNYLYAAHTVQFAQRQGSGPPGDLTCNKLIVHQVFRSRQIEETFRPWMTKWALPVVDLIMNADAVVRWQICSEGCFTRMINLIQVLDNIQA